MIETLARPLAIVAHDAGAANHIFAWMGEEKATLCLAGPARALWLEHCQKSGKNSTSKSRSFSELDSILVHSAEPNLAASLAGAATVITGTGWESNLEHEARKLAYERGIRSIAVIDHWINYADRFIRKRERVLPDEIWVSDPYAAEIAQATFPTVRVIQQVNAYLAGLVLEVESRQLVGAAEGSDRVLYLLEPIRHVWGKLAVPGEFLALDYFMEQRNRTLITADAEIRLRPHPSDPPGKYEAWLARQANAQVHLDPSATLTDAIAWANVVVGCQTYAMVLAQACRRTVISTVPPWAPPCALPHKGIIKMADEGWSGFLHNDCHNT
jgi:hypothetical protein